LLPRLFRPVQVKDTNGNYISITYVANHNQLISTITDTLGRVIQFNYDGSNRLTSVKNLAGTKTYATFQWDMMYGNGHVWYTFSGLTPTAPDFNTPLNVMVGCTYPNNTKYRFTYGDWGIIKKIENLSSTGLVRSYVSYNYPPGSQAVTDAPTYTTQTFSPDGS